jgi:hypothetical protein
LDRLFVIIAGMGDASITKESLARLIQERGDVLSAEIRAVNDRLTVIEEAMKLIPDLEFVRTSPVAQEVIAGLRELHAKPKPPIEGLMVPEGPPGRSRRSA